MYYYRPLVLLLFPVLLACNTTEPSRDLPIVPLENQTWHLVSGFKPEYASGLPVSELRNSIEIQKFPVQINHLLKLEPGSGLTEATLQSTLEIPEEYLKRPLGLHFPWIGEGWALYVNGHKIQDQIYLDEHGKDLKYRRIFRHLTIPLNNALLHKGSNTLVIHFVGYRNPTPWEENSNHGLIFSGGYELAPLNQIEREHTDTLRIVVATVYLFFGLYHLVIFSRRRTDRYNLFFGLFCFFLAMDSVTGTLQLHISIDETAWINRVKYLSQALLIPLFMSFLQNYFNREEETPFLVRMYSWSLGILGAAFLIVPFNYTELMLRGFHLIAGTALVYSIYFIGRIIWMRKRDSLLFGFSIIILIFSGLWGVLDSEMFHTGVHLLPYGFLFCILSLVFILANRFLTVHNESERLNLELTEQKNAFHRFVPTQFLNHLGRSSAVEVMAGDSVLREMTVLFCDIRSFTTLSEGSGPQETFSLLNEHLQQMEPIIYRQGGFVDKYVGDAILSLFSDDRSGNGNGSKDYNSAQRAVMAAIEMAALARSAEMQRTTGARDNFLPGFGIGINSGNLVLGTVGSPSRIDTTVIGDTVNTCSRLESLTTHYGCPILISGQTMARIPNPELFHIRMVDEVYLRGKKQKTAIYEVFDADPPEQLLQKNRSLVRFDQALSLYREGKFQESLELFQKLKEKAPLDQILPLYVERIKGLLAGETQNWEGAVQVIGS
ncbi:MAG: adenylate/guanylate cyclase domain-containing protein [Leptospiraceae bacterium]|nr:adenylate/guanylate cyclase domain-containing protein [Leptospiraceae bacterium]